MKFIFVESSLETVPEEIKNHPDVVKSANRRGKLPEKILLDSSIHHRAMKGLEKREKRGRPDILHHCLLALLDSSLKDFEIFVHTVDGKIIWINRVTRLPRNYSRFVGLMEDLFERCKIQADGVTLLEIRDDSLKEILTENTVVLKEGYDESGLLTSVNSELAICIGAFPHGDFSNEIMRIFEKKNARFAGFGDEPKTSLYATYKAVCMLERFG